MVIVRLLKNVGGRKLKWNLELICCWFFEGCVGYVFLLGWLMGSWNGIRFFVLERGKYNLRFLNKVSMENCCFLGMLG